MARNIMTGPFADAFSKASYGESAFETWQRFVYMSAYEIARASGNDTSAFADMYGTALIQAEPRSDAYRRMFDAWIKAVDENPFQDFLGDAFMRLGIGNEAGGQFFTPYHLARLVAEGAIDSHRISEGGWVSALEPACGAGANVIAMCDALQERGFDWQHGAYFVCQDISELTALMCYMQLSIIGAAATVIVGDTLRMQRRYALHTFVAMTDDLWTARYLKSELSDVW